MASKKRTARRQHDSAIPAASHGAGAVTVFRRIGERIGLLELGSADELAEARVENETKATPPRKESTSPPAQQQYRHVADATLNISVLRQELGSLSRGLAGEATVEPVGRTLHSVLLQKKIALIGFGGTEQESLQVLLGVQSSVAVLLDHTQAALVPAPWQDCDLIMMNSPPEWAITEPIDPGCWTHINKPTLVFGTKSLLTRVARVIQSGPRDFIPAPWTDENVTWRAAMLLSRSLGTPPQRTRPARSSKPEVVIAEDDPTTRALLSAMLSRHGMVCHVADNGGTALDLVRSVHPDAVILDVSMPCLNGFQVLASIKQDPSLVSTQVVLLTSRQTEVDVLQGFGLGADDYMTKPFSPMELAARIKRLLARIA